MADDSITPPEPQTTEECILAAMSGNYPADKIEPQTRERELMKAVADKGGTVQKAKSQTHHGAQQTQPSTTTTQANKTI